MKFNAFSAGVTPGGLRNKNDIKLLICYILSSIRGGLSKENILTVLTENNLANYFEANSAFSELLEDNNISEKINTPGTFLLTDSGKTIALELDKSLPLSVRDKTLKATINLLHKIKSQKENKSEIIKTKDGYSLNCSISGGEIALLNFNLFVPDLLQATLVQENFNKNPETIYKCLLSILTEDRSMLKDILANIRENNSK